MSNLKSGSDMVRKMTKYKGQKLQKKRTTQLDLITLRVDYFPTAYIKTNLIPCMTK